ncbi:hypothetical protein GPALN_003652 [Globodera pallida]|nr:hypothetical protein GPALN_003652 [Globodera pallida]
MALVSKWRSDWPSLWRDRFSRDLDDWPRDWPRPGELMERFRSRDFDRDHWWRDWPTDWPRMDAIVPRFSSYLDRFDRNWRDDPFWRDLYPRWAEPIFKDGIDVKTNIVNDNSRFAVEIDTYQFRPEELQDVRDRENYTKMYFVRKYLLPADVEPHSISSHIDSSGRLSVEAQKRWQAIEGERSIPIESGSRRYGSGYGSRSSSHSPRDRYYADSGRGSANDQYRVESRANGAASGGAYLSPNPRSDGYRTEYEKRETDANGMRHEARREEFREEFRRSGSAANVLPPLASPMLRTDSRLSGGIGGNSSAGEERRESSHFRRTASASSREHRSGGGAFSGGGENLLRPAEELGGRSSAFGTRNVPIHRG